MTAGLIRDALVGSIRRARPNPATDRIWPEMPLCLGASRVDVGVINGTLTGYEIKSERDRIDRLARQIDYYGRVLDRSCLVASARHLSAAEEAVPGWWGLMLVDSEGGLVRRLEQVRAMSRNPDQDPDSVVQLLWRDEAYDELVQRGLHHGLARATRWSLWDTLVEHVDLVELLGVVRARLMARPAWRAS